MSRETEHKHQALNTKITFLTPRLFCEESTNSLIPDTDGDKSYDISFFLSSCQILHSYHLYPEDNTMDKAESEEQISESGSSLNKDIFMSVESNK